MKRLIQQISNLGDAFLKDANAQLDKGNKAAGLRARCTSLTRSQNLLTFSQSHCLSKILSLKILKPFYED